MALLVVDSTSPEWHRIKLYIEARIVELSETCTSTMSSHEQRMTAAHRIEELGYLLKAPETTRAVAEGMRSQRPVEVY